MRNLKRISAAILALLFIVLFAACGRAKIESPTGFDIDDENTLRWEAVPEARSYRVEVAPLDGGETAEESTRRTEFSLDDLSEGDYLIRVRTVGGSGNNLISPWSETIEFHKDFESGVRYKLINNNTEYEVSNWGKSSGEVVIEQSYRGKPVTSIGGAAFRSCNTVESVIISEGIRSIGANAFYNCSKLAHVEIPSTVTSLGASAFQNCSLLEEVKIPESIAVIPEYTFAYCRSLTQIEIPSSVIMIGEAAFSNCSGLTSLEIPDSVIALYRRAFSDNDALASVTIGAGMQAVGSSAFNGCKNLTTVTFKPSEAPLVIDILAFGSCPLLTTVNLREGTTAIGASCFALDSSLASLSIPDSVTSVGASAFEGTKLLGDQEGNAYYYADDWLIGCSDETYDGVTEITEGTFKASTVGIAAQAFLRQTAEGFQGCPNLRTLRVPDSVKYIGDYAFYSSAHLATLTTSSTGQLETIGESAFAYCPTLGSVIFEGQEHLKDIGAYAFYECVLLNNHGYELHYTVPGSVTHIGEGAYQGTALAQTNTDGVIYAGYWAVDHVDSLQGNVNLGIPRGGTTTLDGIADFAFEGAEELQGVEIPENMRALGQGAFFGCASLQAVNLGNSLTEIPAFAFYNCPRLYGISFPRVLERIGDYAFSFTGLYTVDLSRQTRLQSIGNYAFDMCSYLVGADLGTHVTTIGTRAFYGCAIVELDIPDSVTTIGEAAFAKNRSLLDVHFGSGIRTIGRNAFRSSTIKEAILPDSLTYIAPYAFFDTPLEKVSFGNNLTQIGDYAFAATALRSVYFPESVRLIGEGAFMACPYLTSAVFAAPVDYMGTHAFNRCNSLTVFVAGEEEMGGGWNSSFRPAVYGCTLSEEGYVTSVTVGDIKYFTAMGGIGAPAREGYIFDGWASEEGGEVVYSAKELPSVPAGTTVYAVYHADENA